VDIAQEVNKELDKEDPVSGGSLLQMPELLVNLTDLHKRQVEIDADDSSNKEYTENTFLIIDQLLRETTSWQEIPSEDDRHTTTSLLLQEVSSINTEALN
jgi:hypothetical protein